MEAVGNEDPGFDGIVNRDMYERALEMLDENEQKVIQLRYGEGLSQKSIAEEFGVSQMYISRLEKKIYSKLRKKIGTN